MKVISFGGSEIGGSLYRIHYQNGINDLVDCGMIMSGSEKERGVIKTPMLPDGMKIRYIFITHAHLDHSGGVVELLSSYPEATAVMTSSTLVMTEMLLRDAYGYSRKSDVALIPEDRVKIIKQAMSYELAPDLKVTFWPNGHVRGSALVIIRADGKTVVFSGDLGHEDLPTVSGYNLSRFSGLEPDALFLESTYGEMELPPREEEVARLVKECKKVARNGGNVLIPAFAFGRSADVAISLAKSGIKVYLDGMAVHMMDQMIDNPDAKWGNDKAIHPHYNIFYVMDWESRLDLLRGLGKVVIASSGWLIGGKSTAYLKWWLNRKENAVFFPGPFQKYAAEELLKPETRSITITDPDTRCLSCRGWLKSVKVKSGDKDIYVCKKCRTKYGELPKITLIKRARCERFLISSHSGQSGLVRFAQELKPAKIVLTHGEQESKASLKERFGKDMPLTPVEIGYDGQEVEL